ncbi:MAG: N-6 DNA methylase [Gemmatimonadota bacterium]
MALREVLAQIQRLEDLPALAGELGFAPTWHELLHESRTALIGRRASCCCFGVERADAEGAARALARSLAARGQPAVVVALDPAARRLAVSAAAEDFPTVRISLASPSVLEIGVLERAALEADPTGAGLALGWARVLASEAVGARFFRQFRETLTSFTLELAPQVPRADRHALALLQLTRVLFLYFVQAKGWLDGRPTFLIDELDRCLARGRSVHRHLLQPLFFGTLNRPAPARSAAVRRFGAIPFLNGGLFEPHALERRWSGSLGNGPWREAFDKLFERFQFTLGTAAGPGIAPDMLGRVFEGVMDPDERRQSGSFYTPSDLVDALVEEALATWLAPALAVSEPRARRLLFDPDPGALRLLRGITVLDPAAGSGAFLLGALRALVRARTGAGESRTCATRDVLARNLFGVDLNPAAIRLAELRLWLEVIETEPGGRGRDVAPLPNLDQMVRQGDSLIEPSLTPWTAAPGTTAALAALRREVSGASGAAKRVLVRKLREEELAVARRTLLAHGERIDERLKELISGSRSPTLFGERATLDRRGAAELTDLRAARRRIRGLSRRLERAAEVPWFHYGAQFGDVMANGGFDLVVGNPPWVRGEAIAPEIRSALRARYRWFQGGGRTRGFANAPDLSIAFLERSLELVRPGGTIALLVPAKLSTATYATRARADLTARTTLCVVADLRGDARAAFEATVYPCALIAARRAPAPRHRVRTGLSADAPTIPQDHLDGEPWILSAKLVSDALRASAACHPTVGERFPCHLGVKTGANAVFLDPTGPIEPALLRRALRGRDVSPFQISPRRRLLWTHDARGAVLRILPPLAADYLAGHAKTLGARRDYTGGPRWAVFRTEAAASPSRVVWADLARELAAAPLTADHGPDVIPLNSCYVLVAPDDETAVRLAAWLNSASIRALARARANPAASGFCRFNAATVAALPCPDLVLTDPSFELIAREALAGRLDQAALDLVATKFLESPSDGRSDAGPSR